MGFYVIMGFDFFPDDFHEGIGNIRDIKGDDDRMVIAVEEGERGCLEMIMDSFRAVVSAHETLKETIRWRGNIGAADTCAQHSGMWIIHGSSSGVAGAGLMRVVHRVHRAGKDNPRTNDMVLFFYTETNNLKEYGHE